MGRFVPINITSALAEKTAPINSGAKTYYDGKQCWQYKVVYDRPGTYTFTVPSGVTCARSVIIGGGGRPKCINSAAGGGDGSGCNSWSGAGGAYSEKCMTVVAGNTFSITVGKQEMDTTLCCNTVLVHTAGGAAGNIPGVATGGDWNSRGGCAGYTCNQCNGSYSHFCGSCKYLCLCTLCGYCVVFQCDPASTGGSCCCNLLVAGGGSAGSPRALCGGNASCICGYIGSAVAGGGAGIGMNDANIVWHYNCCSCVCTHTNQIGWTFSTVSYPASAEGGGGSSNYKPTSCRSWGSQSCQCGWWQAGHGGSGGPESATCGWTFEWGYDGMCMFPYGIMCSVRMCEINPSYCICKQDWWDITDICGSGSPGTIGEVNYNQCGLCLGIFNGIRPMNAGEGAGTGGIASYCCAPNWLGHGAGATDASTGGPLVNWCKICQLGVCNQTEQAWLMQDSLFPFFITCAGTLGGSGGVTWPSYTSKAGKGGGGGQAKCQIVCICWGGAFNCCNGNTANPALAFPPCLLDTLVSNAGTGMAIIYYREA